MSHGFDIVSRTEWSARAPRGRVTRHPTVVSTVYLHWPGVSGSLRETAADLLAGRVAPPAELRAPEGEADECVLPQDLLPENFFGSESGRIDTRAEERRYMREIQRFHMDVRRWSDFAYNYMIFQSGRIYAGRTFKVVPASQAPYNTTGVSICCAIGSADSVSSQMRENLVDFVRWCEKYARHDLAVKGHRQVNQTSCPGDRLMSFVPRLDRL